MICVCICAQHTTNKITYVHQNKWKHKENSNFPYGQLVMESIETHYPNLIQGPHCFLKKVGQNEPTATSAPYGRFVHHMNNQETFFQLDPRSQGVWLKKLLFQVPHSA